MNKRKNLNQDELRQKVDGFSLDNSSEKNRDGSYITTDQGVYSTPDYAIDKKIKK